MGWDMFPIALAIQAAAHMFSNPYVYQAVDLLDKEDVQDWLEDLITNDPYPSKGGLSTAFKEAVHTYVYGWIGKAKMHRLLGCRIFQRIIMLISSSFPPGLRPRHETGGAGGAGLPAMPIALQEEEKAHGVRSSLLEGCPALGQLYEAESWGAHGSPQQC